MATMTVKDAAGSSQTIEKPNANGRVAAAASRPVVLSTEDLAAIAAITAKLISAPATEAKQDALNTLITTQNGYLDGLEASATSELAATQLVGTRAYGSALTRLAYTGTSAQSAVITATEVLLHNCGTARCYIAVASSPTATVNDIPLETGEKFHLRITSGHKVAAIQDSTGGNLNIVPVA